MKNYYSYAGVNICIEGLDDYMYQDERDLAYFRVDGLDPDNVEPDVFKFEVAETLKKPIGRKVYEDSELICFNDNGILSQYIGPVGEKIENAFMQIEENKKLHYVTIKKSMLQGRIPVHVVFQALQSERLMKKVDSIIIHASYIEYQGKAILFTAPSGAGKSTQAELWRCLRGANIINGDRVGIKKEKDECSGVSFYAYGVPFAGSSNICKNITRPIAAIVCLAQSNQTRIEKIGGARAFRLLYEGCGISNWDKGHVDYVTDFIVKMVKDIPIYHLSCTPDESAVNMLEEVLIQSGVLK